MCPTDIIYNRIRDTVNSTGVNTTIKANILSLEVLEAQVGDSICQQY